MRALVLDCPPSTPRKSSPCSFDKVNFPAYNEVHTAPRAPPPSQRQDSRTECRVRWAAQFVGIGSINGPAVADLHKPGNDNRPRSVAPLPHPREKRTAVPPSTRLK